MNQYRPTSRSHFALLSTIALVAIPALAQEEVEEQRVEAKSFRAVRVSTAPVVDGLLDDPVWQQAEAVTDFH